MLFSGGLASLVYALIESGRHGFGATAVITAFLAAAVLLVVFVVVEARTSHPMFDLRLFRLPTFVGGNLGNISGAGSRELLNQLCCREQRGIIDHADIAAMRGDHLAEFG